ncbi:MAG TPA: ABC transporter permease [Blastocatellia bacterium]
MLARLVRRLHALFRPSSVDREMDDELRYHLERDIARKVASGHDPDEARRSAFREFGGYELAREECREARRVTIVEDLGRDISYGVRRLRKNLGFTAVAVVSLALGIGACTAIFSVVDSVLLRSLPYPDSERLVEFSEINKNGAAHHVADPNFRDVRDQSDCFAAITEYADYPTSVVGGTEPLKARITVATAEFFDVIGVFPYLGHRFSRESTGTGHNSVAVVSYGFWRHQLGGRPDFTNATVKIDPFVCQVVGVMPRGFSYPNDSDIWIPRSLFPDEPSRDAHNWLVLARLAPAVPLGQARAETSAIYRHLKEIYGQDIDAADFALTPLRNYVIGDVGNALGILCVAVAVLLLVACTNVANLMLAQVASRQREIAVRAALGASRRRLAFQMMTESALLALAAGAIGASLAAFGVKILVGLNKSAVPRAGEIGVDIRILGFTLLLSLLVAMILGLIPLVRLSDTDLHSDLKDSGRGLSTGAAGNRLRSVFTVSQVALTMILLVGAGLLVRSFYRLLQVDPGFRLEKTLAMNVSFPQDQQADQTSTDIEKFFIDFTHGRNPAPPPVNKARQQRVAQLYQQLLDPIGRIPGVTAAGAASALPLAEFAPDGTFWIDNNIALKGYANFTLATQGYFKAMGIPLLSGRLFEPGDGPTAPPVAVISQSLKQAVWPGENPIGKRIQFGNMDGDVRLIQIVGVVGDVHQYGVDTSVAPAVYVNAIQRPNPGDLSVVVHSDGDTKALVGAMRSIVRDINPDAPADFHTLEETYSSSLDPRRFSLVIFAVFAGVALTLAAIGIYGVMSYSVTERLHEIGVRMALGARSSDVWKLILAHGLKLTVIGIALGTAGAIWLTRLMTSLLFAVKPGDRATFALGAAVLAAVALSACYIPGRRATRVDPVTALHDE